MDDTAIMLKGTSDGILLRPKSSDWEAVLAALGQALEEADAFFRGGRLIMDLGLGELTQTQLTSVRTLVSQYDIQLWAILSENDNTVHLARSNGILTRLPRDNEPRKPTAEVRPEQQALLIQQTLRSGQSIHYPGHITLVGDVNPGAEIVAGGSIIVWGALRGLAHAGAFGDEESVICALELQPSQLRIAGHIGRSPEQRRRNPVPEIARVEEDHIVAEVWNRKR